MHSIYDFRHTLHLTQSTNKITNTRHHSFVLANGTVVRKATAASSQQLPTPTPTTTTTTPPAAAAAVAHSPLVALTVMTRLAGDALNHSAPLQKRQPQSQQFIDSELLSKNISFLLENLLKRYEKSHLPTHGQGVPTVVKTNMVIRSMGPVSELDMDYSMDCYFRQHWRDTRLKFRGPMQTLSLSIKMLERIWRPDTYFYNGKHSHIHLITVPNKLLRLTQDGDILYSMRCVEWLNGGG